MDLAPTIAAERAEPSAEAEERRAAALERLARRRAGEDGDDAPLDLSGLRLIGADLAGLDLARADLSHAELSRADLCGASLFGARLAGATLFEADLSGAELSGADLSGANLEGATLARAGLGRGDLSGAKLVRADLSGATLSDARLAGADLRLAVLEGARLLGADLSHADLSQARLARAVLDGCRVDGAVLDEADLRGASLQRVVGYKLASWLGVDLREIDFTGAYLLRGFVMDQNFIEEFRAQSTWSRIVHAVWRATSDCGRSVTRWAFCTGVLVFVFAWLYTLVGIDYGSHPTTISPLYFSVVTLTTLGYGDVLPASVAAQVVAMLEVVSGYVMLGGLLSIFSNKMARRAD